MRKISVISGFVLVVALAVGLSLLWTQGGESQAQEPPPPNLGHEVSAAGLIPIVDSGWITGSSTSDCTNYTGWGDDQWELTLTSAQDVAISVDDCCCPGDFYEVYVDGTLVGTTPDLSPPWGCSYTGPMSSDTFTCSLQPGTYLIEVRDAGLDGHTPAEIVAEDMCPAGYTVSGALSTYTGQFPCGPVGGIVDLRSGSSGGSATPYYIALATGLAAAVMAAAAGAWYTRRRLVR
jgi:hypothetical protein